MKPGPTKVGPGLEVRPLRMALVCAAEKVPRAPGLLVLEAKFPKKCTLYNKIVI